MRKSPGVASVPTIVSAAVSAPMPIVSALAIPVVSGGLAAIAFDITVVVVVADWIGIRIVCAPGSEKWDRKNNRNGECRPKPLENRFALHNFFDPTQSILFRERSRKFPEKPPGGCMWEPAHVALISSVPMPPAHRRKNPASSQRPAPTRSRVSARPFPVDSSRTPPPGLRAGKRTRQGG